MDILKVFKKYRIFIIKGPFVEPKNAGDIPAVTGLEIAPVNMPGIIIRFGPEYFHYLFHNSKKFFTFAMLELPGPDMDLRCVVPSFRGV